MTRRGRASIMRAGAVAIGTLLVAVAAYWFLGPKGTRDARLLVGALERMAAFQDLDDADALSAAFSIPFRGPWAIRIPTTCPGGPIQAEDDWQSAGPWSLSPGGRKDAPALLLRAERKPRVCPSEPKSFRAEAKFAGVEHWRCVAPMDLGRMADRFMQVRAADGSLTISEDTPNSRIILEFQAGGGHCLHSATVSAP